VAAADQNDGTGKIAALDALIDQRRDPGEGRGVHARRVGRHLGQGACAN
jgi:hypothetical protein